jgi:hypothetical protein
MLSVFWNMMIAFIIFKTIKDGAFDPPKSGQRKNR